MPLTLRLGAADPTAQARAAAAIDYVERTSGQHIEACYQCAKCAAGCPLAGAMDLAPQQILRALQLGRPELALQSRTLWLCVSCQTCVTRCPCEIDLPRVMDGLRAWSMGTGAGAAQPEVATFHRVFLKMVELTGRAYEIGLIGGYNLLSRHLFSGFDLAWPMVRRGKIKPLPQRVKARKEIAEIYWRAALLDAQDRAADRVVREGSLP